MIILFKIKLALSIHLLNMSGTLDMNSRSLPLKNSEYREKKTKKHQIEIM